MNRLLDAIKMIDAITEPCKHLRTGGTRTKNGYDKVCLACGYEWFEEDKPLTEDQKADKARFLHEQELNKKR